MDWEDLRHFAAFATEGSLSGAARRLGVEHATVARRIGALETRLGVKLVDRRGRRLILTAEGEQVAAAARQMETDVRAVDRIAGGARSELTGEVVVSAPPAYAALVLAAKLVRLRKCHPGLKIHLRGETRTASLDRREADVAVRLTRPRAGDLTVIKIGDMPFRLYAAEDYLQRTPEREWRFIGADGFMAGSAQQVEMDRMIGDRAFSFRSDHAEIQLALCSAGGGVAILPEFMAAGRSGLVPLSEDPLLVREVWLAVHSDMKNAASVRAVIECLHV